jgi:Pin2-interacting protein X1
MTQQGWSEGQALGARDAYPSKTSTSRHHSGLATDAERLAAARVGILFKDDNLGLGAKRKGDARDVEAQRTGLDAFQGLLGRLNGKGEGKLKEMEKRVEERKLEMFFKGRWGGMVFVRGEMLVGSVGANDGKNRTQEESPADEDETLAISQDQTSAAETESEPRRRLKEEKRLRKEERRKRKEEKALRKAAKKVKATQQLAAESDSDSTSETTTPLAIHISPVSQPPDEPVSSAASDNEAERSRSRTEKKRKRLSLVSNLQASTENSRSSSPSVAGMKNGRHLLRGRNIQAKKMMLDDAKGLDQIFMR